MAKKRKNTNSRKWPNFQSWYSPNTIQLSANGNKNKAAPKRSAVWKNRKLQKLGVGFRDTSTRNQGVGTTMAKGKKNRELRKGKNRITPTRRKPKTEKPRVVRQTIYKTPRFTAGTNATIGVQSRGPDTRLGWCVFLIVILVLIMIIPTLLVNSIGGAAATGFDNFLSWFAATPIGQWAEGVTGAWNNILADLIARLNGG